MRTQLKISIICFIAVLAVRTPVFSAGAGTSRADYLKIKTGARPAAMAGAFGIISDIHSVDSNPAALIMLQKRKVGVSHLRWLENIGYSWAGIAIPLLPDPAGVDSLGTMWIDNLEFSGSRNMLGGEYTIWNDRGAGGNSSVRGSRNAGQYYLTEYDIRPLPDGRAGYGGITTSLNHVNASDMYCLSFDIRGASGGEKIAVNLKDVRGYEYTLKLDNYESVEQHWKEVVVPLENFRGVDLSELESLSFSFEGSGSVYLDNIRFASAGRSGRMVAVTVSYLNTGSMDGYVEIPVPPFYEPSDDFSSWAGSLSFAYAIQTTIGGYSVPLGVNIRMLLENLHPETETSKGAAMDIGAMHQFRHTLGIARIGFALRNIGYLQAAEEKSSPLPFTVKSSFGLFPYNLPAVIAVDIDAPMDEKYMLSLGGEWNFSDTVYARCGYRFGQDKGGLGTGIGFRTGSLRLDYAFAPYSYLGNTHRMSLLWDF